MKKEYWANNWIALISMLVSLALAGGTLLSKYDYYTTSKTILLDTMYSSLEATDNIVNAIYQKDSYLNNGSVKLSFYVSQLKQINTQLGSIDLTRVPNSDIGIITDARYKNTTGLKYISTVVNENVDFRTNDKQREKIVDALITYRAEIKREIYRYENGQSPSLDSLKKADYEFERNYGDVIKAYER